MKKIILFMFIIIVVIFGYNLTMKQDKVNNFKDNEIIVKNEINSEPKYIKSPVRIKNLRLKVNNKYILSDDMSHVGNISSKVFWDDIDIYNLSIPYNSINEQIEVEQITPIDTIYKTTVPENLSLKLGANTFKFLVSDDKGVTTTYTVNVYVNNNDVSISSVLFYDVPYPNLEVRDDFVIETRFAKHWKFESFLIDVKANDPKATVLINNRVPAKIELVGEDGKVSRYFGVFVRNFKVGLNIVDVKITAEDSSFVQNYKLHIYNPSDDNIIANASFNGNNYSKPSNTTVLQAVPYEVSELKVAIEIHPQATIAYTSNLDLSTMIWTLEHGIENVLTVIVTSEDLTQNTYRFKITRKHKIDDNTLNKVTINNKDTIVANKFFNYKSTYKDLIFELNKTLTLNVFPNSTLATVEYLSSDSSSTYLLVHGLNSIKFNIIAQNGLTQTFEITFMNKSNDNVIKNIEVTDHVISPIFSKDTITYNLTVKGHINQIYIDVDASIYATKFGNGTKDLVLGDNHFEVYVINEFNEKGLTYYINVKKLSNDSIITKIQFNNILINNPATFVTLDTVNFDYEYFTLAIERNAKANLKFSSNYNQMLDRWILDIGNNTLVITVIAEDLSETVYTFEVHRENPSNDISLESVTINNTDLIAGDKFINFIYTYKALVFESNKTIELNVTANSDKAEVSYINDNSSNTYPLNYGVNILYFKITAEDKTEQTYKIFIETKSDKNSILDILIDGKDMNPKFNQEITDYYLILKANVTEISLLATTDATARIIGNGKFKLIEDQSTFVIYALNEFNEEGTKYFIHVYRQSNDTSIKELWLNDIKIETNLNVDNIHINIPFTQDVIFKVNALVNPLSTIKGNEEYKIVHGLNDQIVLVVIAEDGTTRSYKLFINALYDLPNISNIKFSDIPFIFDEFRDTTDVVIPKEIKVLSLEVFSHSSNKIYVTYNNIETLLTDLFKKEFDVHSELVEMYIYSISEFGTKSSIYKINFITEEIFNTNNDIINILITNFVLSTKFSNDVKQYHVKVNSNTTSIVINIVKGHEGQIIKISDNINNLKYGENKVDITVTSSNNLKTTIFTLYVIRPEQSNNLIYIIIIVILSLNTLYLLFRPRKRSIYLPNRITIKSQRR